MNTRQRTRRELEPKVKKLRARLVDVIETDPKFDDYFYLVQWLKRQQYKVSKTETIIREAVKWRKTNNIDALAQQDLPASFPEISKIVKVDFCGQTKYGQPIVTINGDGVDYAAILKTHGKENLIRYFFGMYILAEGILLQQIEDVKARNFTRTLKFSDKPPGSQPIFNLVAEKASSDSESDVGSVIDESEIGLEPEVPVGFVAIATCRDFSIWNATNSEVIKALLEVSKAGVSYFPCLASAVYLVNTNKFVSIFYKLLKPMIASQAYTVEVFDTNRSTWSTVLTEDIDPNQLAPEFGGCKVTSCNLM